MGVMGKKLRTAEGALAHWCPGCERSHLIPVGLPYKTHWSYAGSPDNPTFSPSVKHDWTPSVKDKPKRVCHYFIESGQIKFCPDSTHKLAGQTVPLPDYPNDYDFID